MRKHGKMTIRMAYEMVMPYHLHMPSYFLETFTEYPSLKGMIDDIRFLNLLEESHVDFRCIDFPWFCKENLPLIKAVVLYEKLEIRINV